MTSCFAKYDQDLIDPFIIGRDEFLEDCEEDSAENALERVKGRRYYNSVKDTVVEMHWWTYFSEEIEKERIAEALNAQFSDRLAFPSNAA